MFKPKIKTCQNCNSKFTIEPEDFEFYKKVGVPTPTFCPECRMRRRFMFRNERNLSKRKDDLTGKEIFSMFSQESPIKVYERKIWWSDEWDPMEYGQKYDFNKPFFEQIKELSRKVPWPSRVLDDPIINSDYCANGNSLKNCYLAFSTGWSEDCAYIIMASYAKDCYDNSYIAKCELCYDNFQIAGCYKTFFSSNCADCQEVYFSKDLVNCQNCFGCTNLRHKKYHIFNKQYTKEEYFKKLKEFNIFDYNGLIKQKEDYNEICKKAIHKFAQIIKSVNSIGDNLKNVKNCKNAFDVKKAEDCKFVNWGGDVCKDSYDSGPGFGAVAELLYESIDTGVEAAKSFFTWVSFSNYDVQYSINCHSSSNLFACVGLRHKQYCILNKQYTKKEYEELVPQIKKHMNDMPYTDKKGRVYKYGEFFPPELSPFGYNETIANEYFPLTKEEAIEQGYNWYDKPKNEYKPTIKASNLPDNIKDVDDSILKEVIECDSNNCAGSNVFRIIPQELKFYKKMNLPLPHLCPDCRHRERIKQRNPLKLWKRQCMNKGCNNTFQTTYSPDRKEIIYCEGCYNKEVS